MNKVSFEQEPELVFLSLNSENQQDQHGYTCEFTRTHPKQNYLQEPLLESGSQVLANLNPSYYLFRPMHFGSIWTHFTLQTPEKELHLSTLSLHLILLISCLFTILMDLLHYLFRSIIVLSTTFINNINNEIATSKHVVAF